MYTPPQSLSLANLFPPEILQTWGWRVPFLLSGLFGIVAFLLGRHLPESPTFHRSEQARCPSSPLREAFTCNRVQMVQGILFACAYGALFYLTLVYMPIWVSEVTGISLASAMRANTLTLALLLPVIPFGGWVSDRFVRRVPLLLGVFMVVGAVTTVSFIWMSHGTFASVVSGQVISGLILAIPLGAAPAMFTELFPEDDRLTGYSIVFNVGLGVVGGTTPMVASWLILITGSDLAPVALTVFWAAVSVAVLAWMRDRSREPLRTSCGSSIHAALAISSTTALDERARQGRCGSASNCGGALK